jgi:hypothetical protein
MSRGLALLFGAGATLVAITVVLPHRHGEGRVGLLIPVVVAYVVVGVLLSGPQRFSPASLHGLLAVGTALIGLCVIYGDRAGGAYAFMYVWVALYAAAFFSVGGTGAHLAWAFGSYVAVLALTGDVRPPHAQWLMAAGTSAVAAALILGLSRELRGRASDLAAVAMLANELGSASEVDGERVAADVCSGVLAAAGASAVVLLAADDGATGLHVLGRAGAQQVVAFDRPEGIAALDEAYGSGQPARLLDRPDGSHVGLVQPVLRDGRVCALLAVGWERPRRRLGARIEGSIALFAAEAGVALERIARQSRDRERRAVELNDAIVQGLVVAQYALRDGRVEVGERAVAETLDRARALVENQLETLHGSAAPKPGSLRRDGRGIG